MNRYALLPVAFLLLGLAGCSSRTATGVETSAGFPAPDQEMVYATAVSVLAKYGHSPDMDLSDPRTGEIVTRWKNSLQPFSGKGYREKVTITIRPVPGRANYYVTDTQVVRQKNNNMTEPSSLLAAEWSGESREAEMETLINQQIEMSFLPGGLSPRFRERYGLRRMDDPRVEGVEPAYPGR